MSDHNKDSNHPAARLLGAISGGGFAVLVPLVLVVMLGYVGINFAMAIVRVEAPESQEASAPVAAAAPAAATPATPAPSNAAAPAPAPAAPAAAAGAATPDMAAGKLAYMTCAACHGPDGTGLKVGPSLMAPSLVGSEVLLGDPDKPLLIVLKGIAKENMDFMGMMAPLAAGLDDAKLAAVLNYVRNEWGNSAPPITVEQAAAARAKFGDVNAPAGVKRAEIDAIVEAHK